MALLPVEDALGRILAGVDATPTEHVALLDAAGRVLAEPLHAKLTQPPFDTSAMDGFAVHAADVAHASVETAVTLQLVGESAAGHAFAGVLERGHAVRISTGAPIPTGADTVVIQEDTDRDGSLIRIKEPAHPGQHIRRRGFDFTAGAALLQPGHVLNERAIALAAAAGFARLPVHRKPVVAILATGDELVEPGTHPGPDQIVSSNGYGLAALVARAGGAPRLLGIARDSHAAIGEGIARSQGADVLVTIGGASVGDHDLIGPVLTSAGASIDFWKVAMRPGKPMLFGRLGHRRVLGLPGNPVSCLITARVFLVPLLARLLARPQSAATAPATLATPLEANGPRTHFMRASLSPQAAGQPPLVTPLVSQDSSALSLLTAADCLIVRPAGAPPAQAGDVVPTLSLDF